MTLVDLLSDTIYRQQVAQQLHQLLGNDKKFPVEPSQIHGLRQIARQEPERIEGFANHQGQRAQSRYDAEDEKSRPRAEVLQKWETEVNFWTLVANFCGDSPDRWSVIQERNSRLPAELQNRPDMSRRERREIGERRDKWCERWDNEHIPAFFERFCTHCLFCIAKAEMGQLGGGDTNETDPSAQQDQSDNQSGGAMETAFEQANLVE